MEKPRLKQEKIQIRHDFNRDEIRAIYGQPLTHLLWHAGEVHRAFFPKPTVQMSTLLSVKTGGCKENCGYCAQSAHHEVKLKNIGFLKFDEIVTAAQEAKQAGSTRFCMGAAWRTPPKAGKQFETVLQAAREVKSLGMEVCMTLGMLDDEQAGALKHAGVDYYNHNIDTSPEYYEKIVSTRDYGMRLATVQRVRKAGMSVCCGGIVGLGETREDRIGFLVELCRMEPHPESVPINLLVKVPGTPLADAPDLDLFEMVRTIATARILMPRSHVRLSAGRRTMSDEAHALCFAAGANSIFMGDRLLTTENPDREHDLKLLDRLGLVPEERNH